MKDRACHSFSATHRAHLSSALRKAEGCVTVEMEAAAFFAVARFRGVSFGQLLYGGDDVSSDEWDSRHWEKQTSVREKLFWLSAEACLSM